MKQYGRTNIAVFLVTVFVFCHVCEITGSRRIIRKITSDVQSNSSLAAEGSIINSTFNNLHILPALKSTFILLTCCKLKPPQTIDDVNWTDNCRNKDLHLPSNLKVIDEVWQVPAYLMSTKTSFNFSLQQKKPICNKGLFKVNISWNSSSTLYTNGYLGIGNEFYAPDEYCIDGFLKQDLIEVMVCHPDCGKTRACIPKCCNLDELYTVGVNGSRGCRLPQGKLQESQNSVYFNPPLYHDFYTQLSIEEMNHEPLPHFFRWRVANFKSNCPANKTTIFPSSAVVASNLSNFFNVPFHAMDFRIRRDGAFLYRNAVQKKCGAVQLNPKRFLCFEGAQDFGKLEPYSNSEDEMVIFICSNFHMENFESNDQSKELVYGVLMLAVSVFPFLTSLVYFLVWSKQNIHGWTIASTTGSLFCMYIFQGSAFVIGSIHQSDKIETMGCTIIAILSHFFFLATFSWLTVMCGDLYWTFRSLTPTNRRSKGMKKFINYSLFAWGLPTAFVTTGVILDYTSNDCTSHTVPGYGLQSCWIIPTSQGLYIFYPVAILLFLNVFFFAVTCFKLCRYRKNTKFATKTNTSHQQGFSRFTKLFLVMGISWIFDIISWSIDGLKLRWYWIVFDVINILRAVGVFVVYVCKRDILLLLEDTHPPLKRVFDPFKRRCSDDLSEQTGSTGVVGPMSFQFPSFRMSR